MAYGLLPNKKQATYKKLFKMIKSQIKVMPYSVNCDFEKAAINAVIKVFGDKCKINGCFFHLSQAILRRIRTKGFLKHTFKAEYRKSVKLLQSLAFLPVKDVIAGFEMIKTKTVASFKPILDYFEKTYIGSFKPINIQ